MFRVEDEGDGRNDARVAHARPIVAKSPVELPCGQMMPRRWDRAGTRRWRSLTSPAAIALFHLPRPALQSVATDFGKIRPAKWTKLPPIPGLSLTLVDRGSVDETSALFIAAFSMLYGRGPGAFALLFLVAAKVRYASVLRVCSATRK